jgi:eukaryotic-like serine/threonine-protein kinase
MDWGGASAAQMDADPPSLIGALVAGKYRVDSLLGSGSTGDVYLCTHTGLDKVVALKILHADMVKHENFVERFKREARAASKLEHPNSVRVLDFGEDPNGILYIAMEYIAGRDLWTLLDEEWPLDNARIVDIMSQVLGALGKAHSLGIVHRDLKPENIMVQPGGGDDGTKDHVTVCDFGIAQLSPIQLSGSFSPVAPTVTGDGMVVGTPAYMSPEQARAEPLDARSDVYSAGIVLFQMLTRQLPFTAETPLAVAVMHCSTPPPTPSQLALVHPALEGVCLRALAKTKEARFQSARDMQLALQATLQATAVQLEGRPRARKRRPYLPLSVPPVAVPPPARSVAVKTQPPASLAPFELLAEVDTPARSPRGQKRMWAVLAVVALFGGVSAMQLYRVADSPPAHAADEKASQPGGQHMDPTTATTATTATTTTTGATATTAIATSAAQPPADSEPQPQAAPVFEPAASAHPTSQPLVATVRPEERPDAPRAARAGSKQQVKSPAPQLRIRPRQPAATDGELSIPTLRTSPITVESAGPAAVKPTVPPEVTAKPAPASTIVAEGANAPQVSQARADAEFEPDIPVGLVDLPSRMSPGSADAPKTTVTPAIVPSPLPVDHAQVRFSSIVSSAAVSRASIRNALNEAAMRRCYADALRLGAAGASPMTAQMELQTNMAGRIEVANVTSSGLPKALTNCIEQVARSGRVREVDTGTARATVTLEFQP